MNEIQTYHHRAMELADGAFAAKSAGDASNATDLFRRAYESERQAALLVSDDLTAEPTRSVLHRSAASLALQAGELRAAERLIATALAGDPPPEIAEELRTLFRQMMHQRRRAHRTATRRKDSAFLAQSSV